MLISYLGSITYPTSVQKSLSECHWHALSFWTKYSKNKMCCFGNALDCYVCTVALSALNTTLHSASSGQTCKNIPAWNSINCGTVTSRLFTTLADISIFNHSERPWHSLYPRAQLVFISIFQTLRTGVATSHFSSHFTSLVGIFTTKSGPKANITSIHLLYSVFKGISTFSGQIWINIQDIKDNLSNK